MQSAPGHVTGEAGRLRVIRPATGRTILATSQRNCGTATMKRLLLVAIRLYQLCLSPFVGGQCRFYPSCSEYATEAIDTHGALRGSWLALRRLLRCNPWHPGGFDPVPPAR
jgi:putative membrane protein insertion efficiency factor